MVDFDSIAWMALLPMCCTLGVIDVLVLYAPLLLLYDMCMIHMIVTIAVLAIQP